nr:unnamed protein product [Digitaria exilis]
MLVDRGYLSEIEKDAVAEQEVATNTFRKWASKYCPDAKYMNNQPALEKDRYKIRQAFVAAPGNSLIVADYGQLELRILAHLTNCKSMLDAFKAGGDFHSRTAMNMYQHIRDAVEEKRVLLEWHPQPGQEKPPVPLLKYAFGAERRKAKMLNFSIAYGKTPFGLTEDWKVWT